MKKMSFKQYKRAVSKHHTFKNQEEAREWYRLYCLPETQAIFSDFQKEAERISNETADACRRELEEIAKKTGRPFRDVALEALDDFSKNK